MVTGRAMPLDGQPTADGTVVLRRHNTAEVLSGDKLAACDAPLYKAHFASCPQAGAWRRKPER